VKLQERSDYAELVEKLQKEIDQLRSQLKHQRQLLVADDSKLTAKCAALTDKVCTYSTRPFLSRHWLGSVVVRAYRPIVGLV